MMCHFLGVMGTFLILKNKKTIIYAWKFHDQLQLWKIQITLIFLQAALLFFAQELFENESLTNIRCRGYLHALRLRYKFNHHQYHPLYFNINSRYFIILLPS